MTSRKPPKSPPWWWLQWLLNLTTSLNMALQSTLAPLWNLIDYRRPWGPADRPCYGDPRDTFCSVVGKMREAAGGKLTWHTPLARLIDRGMELVDKHHTLEAIVDWTGWGSLRRKK